MLSTGYFEKLWMDFRESFDVGRTWDKENKVRIIWDWSGINFSIFQHSEIGQVFRHYCRLLHNLQMNVHKIIDSVGLRETRYIFGLIRILKIQYPGSCLCTGCPIDGFESESESESECKCLTCNQKPTGSQFSLLHESN